MKSRVLKRERETGKEKKESWERGEIEFSSRRSFKERERSKDYVLAADKKKGNKSFKTEVTKKKTKI